MNVYIYRKFGVCVLQSVDSALESWDSSGLDSNNTAHKLNGQEGGESILFSDEHYQYLLYQTQAKLHNPNQYITHLGPC